jgi:DNA-binding GntR family transcriptional regulator
LGIRKETYCQQVVEYVHHALRSGELLPGTPLTEQMLVDRLEISRAPIREALQILTNEGLIVTYLRKGRLIKSLTPKEIMNSTFIAGTLEGALAVLAISDVTENRFGRMAAILAEMETLGMDEASMLRMEALGNEFHRLVCGVNAMDSMVDYARSLCKDISKMLYYRHWKNLFTPAERHARHTRVYEALLSRDPSRIEYAVREHHLEVGVRLCERLQQEEARQVSRRAEEKATPWKPSVNSIKANVCESAL